MEVKLTGKKKLTRIFTKLSYVIVPPKVHGFTLAERELYNELRVMMVDQGIHRFRIDSALRGVHQYVEAPRALRKKFEKHMGIRNEVRKRR